MLFKPIFYFKFDFFTKNMPKNVFFDKPGKTSENLKTFFKLLANPVNSNTHKLRIAYITLKCGYFTKKKHY